MAPLTPQAQQLAMMKTADHTRPGSRRGASGAWNRLKPVREDNLDVYGLPSRGEQRLMHPSTQEGFFNKITEKYMKLCAMNKDELEQLFRSFRERNSAASSTLLVDPNTAAAAAAAQPPPPPPPPPPPIPPQAFSPSMKELATVLHALRKVREAIIMTGRCDNFAHRAYFFCIHVAILCKDWESYTAALDALLTNMHAKTPLSSSDLKEYVGFMVLDRACRENDLHGARELQARYGYRDCRVERLLKALNCGTWSMFWSVRKAVDGYQRSIIEFAEQRVRVHSLKCLGMSYNRADVAYIEQCTGREWAELVKDGVGWERVPDTDKVLIRQPKK